MHPLIPRIHSLWDELADFDAADTEKSLAHLLTVLCELTNAQNAAWFGAVRLSDQVPNDPVHGWRPRSLWFLHPPSKLHSESVKELERKLEHGDVDITTIRNVAMAGTFRTNRFVDLVPEGYFETAYYQKHFKSVGVCDAIWAGVPINKDSECYFGIYRYGENSYFSPQDRDAVAEALRGLKWFCRRQMLSRGFTLASSPLTNTEREVLGGLLAGLSEKQIAASRNQSPHTTHEYVTNIYRKFGVGNRAALMAIWLGKT